jgi:predicted nucleotidyltransferase
MNLEELHKSDLLMFYAVRGSRSYGTNIASSDTDTHGLYLLPKKFHSGLRDPEYQIQDEKGDNVFYELRRYFNLILSSNPNLIEMLYAPEDCIRHKTDKYDKIVANRDLFISKKCYGSFSNYALSQIKKAKGKNKQVHGKDKFFKEDTFGKLKSLFIDGHVSADWVSTRFCAGVLGAISKGESYSNTLKGVKDYDKFLDDDLRLMFPPKRFDHCYVFPTTSPRIRGYDEMPSRPIPLSDVKRHNIHIDNCHASSVEHIPNFYRLYSVHNGESKGVLKGDKVVCQSIPKKDEWLGYCGNFHVNEIAFQQELKAYKSYWEWMAKRNDARWIHQENKKDLDFDVKNMQHTIRLLYSGINILREGEPIVRFSGTKLKFLRGIREEKCNYDFLINYAEELKQEADCLFKKSTLPEDVDFDKLDDLYRELID